VTSGATQACDAEWRSCTPIGLLVYDRSMANASPRSARRVLRRLPATKSARAALVALAEARGWLVVGSLADLGYSTADLDRIGVALAGDTLSDREHALVVTRVDEASRHVVEIASVMDLATRERWALLAIDVRPTTAKGEEGTRRQVLATLGPCERRLIAERTKEVLAQRREEGVRLGRPPALPGPIRERVRSERAAGRSLRAIAEGLNREAVATAQGGRRWYASTVSKVLAGESGSSEPSTRRARQKRRQTRDDRAAPVRRSRESRR